MTLRVSVVVPTFKRRELLKRCLAALITQDFDRRAFEIIVADDESSAATQALIKSFAAQTSVALRYLSVGYANGPAAARNAGWRAAQGEIIAFTDDDCVPQTDWLQAGVAAFDGDVDGAWGRIRVPLSENPTDYERDAAGLETAEGATANCFYQRAALIEIGGFDERFKLAWREDSDLFFSLLERDYKFVYVPSAVVIHPLRPAPWGVSLWQQRKNEFNALLYKKHPQLYREKVQPAPPWHYYKIVGALLAMILGFLVGAWQLSFIFAGVWILLTAQFCAQRLRETSRDLSHVAEMIVTSCFIPPLAVFWRLRGALRFRVLFL